MKRFILLTMMCAVVWLGASADQLNRHWDRANTAYVNGDYKGALEAYDSILSQRVASPKLYYNIGNAYFKEGKTGKSILYYNKAQRLAPADKDIAFNLAVANGYVKDRINTVPEFFLSRWTNSLRTSASSDTWSILSLVMLALLLSGVLLYLLPMGIRTRKVGFSVAAVSLLMFAVSVWFACAERTHTLDSDQAIIMITAAPVKSSPDNSSKDIFVLHEGTKVTVLDRLGNWSEISIADGNKGWVMTHSIELID